MLTIKNFLTGVITFFLISNLFVYSQNNKYGNTNIDASVVIWQKWEHTFTSNKSYSNPYKDIVLRVQYRKSDGSEEFSAYGFWDGNNKFKIRTCFPSIGEWNWVTSCSNTSDTELHNQSGVVDVLPYYGENQLYKHGLLKADKNPNEKYLKFADGTPFFWLGDTYWIMPHMANFEEWKIAIDDRASKKFNIIQIAGAVNWNPAAGRYVRNRYGDEAFLSDNKYNPEYWQNLDRYIDYANQKGIVIVLVDAVFPSGSEVWFNVENRELFARNLVARYSGNHIIFSGTFDKHYDETSNTLCYKLKEYAERFLVTNHPGTSPYRRINSTHNVIVEQYRNKSYHDFTMNQTGHHSGGLHYIYHASRVWNNTEYDATSKTVINSEAYYSSGRFAKNAYLKTYGGTDKHARQLGWLSILSGSAGYTYGAYGLWNFGLSVDNNLGVVNYRDALKYSSSKDMKIIYEFFESIAWYDLVPNPSAILNNTNVDSTKMAISIDSEKEFAVAFLPENNSIRLKMDLFSQKMNSYWFNTTTAEYIDADMNVANTGGHTFNAPSKGEWALYLKAANIQDSVAVALKVLLKGPYNSQLDEMNNNLNEHIPLESPYVEDDNNILTSVPADIVDWVLVQLRKTPNGSPVASKSALLHKDGRIVANDGITNKIKFSVEQGYYYVVIKHRNHLSVMTPNSLYLRYN